MLLADDFTEEEDRQDQEIKISTYNDQKEERDRKSVV